MADLNVEREGPSIWPWIIGVVILALLIWALVELFGGEEAVVVSEPAESELVTPDVVIGPIDVVAILERPAEFAAGPVQGTARVVEVVSDRGFWIEDAGQRLFVVTDEPRPEIMDIDAGQMIRISDARVLEAANLGQIQGELAPDARRIAEAQPVVLYAPARNIEITGATS